MFTSGWRHLGAPEFHEDIPAFRRAAGSERL